MKGEKSKTKRTQQKKIYQTSRIRKEKDKKKKKSDNYAGIAKRESKV